MKNRLFAGLLALCLMLTLLPAAAAATTEDETVVASGECGKQGNNLTWTLNDTGTLTISGTGDMENYKEDGSNRNFSPWYSYKSSDSRQEIKIIVIGNGVTSIGSYAFFYCSSLMSVMIPNSVTSIGSATFFECSSLTSVMIPDGVTSIEDFTFTGCSSLTDVTIPDSVTSIGTSAFSRCSNLTSVTIPDSVTSIGISAFSECSSLTSVTIPDDVTSIGSYAFTGCSSLTSVMIPNGVTSIEEQTFCECNGLTEISIPFSVTSIKCSAFHGCSALKDIKYDGRKSDWKAMDIDYNNDEVGYNNNSILRATVRCGDGDIVPGAGVGPVSGGGGGGSSSASGEIKLDEGVKYVPYSCQTAVEDYALRQDTTVENHLSYTLVGTLPSGLSLDPKTAMISGVPMAAGTWSFKVKRTALNTDGTDNSTAFGPYSLTILSNTDDAVHVQRPNDYEILEYVGTQDRNNPNHFYKTEYSNETLKIKAPCSEFLRLLIDGVVLRKHKDYTVKEGSTVITIYSQTFQRVGEGTHTIAAEFGSSDKPNEIKRVAQNYTLNISRPSSGGGGPSKPSVNPSAQKPQNPQPQEQQTAIPFTDVSPADWYYDDVVWAYQEGVMQGVDGSRFDPEGKVSQAVIVTVLARLAKVDLTAFEGETEPGFPEGQYFTAAAVWAKRAGLLPEEGAFTGSEATTRNQMAVMLTKYLTSMGKDTTPPAQPVTFEDAAEMSQEGNAAFQVLYQYEIFRGTGGLKMEPAGSTTRAQFAALMHRIYETAIG